MFDSKQAEVEFEENQRLLRKHMQEVQENRSKLTMSNRERNLHQSISSTLRNTILYRILEMKDPVFTTRMLNKCSKNICGKQRQMRRFLESQPSLTDQALKEIKYHHTINGFCKKIFISLRAWNNSRVCKTPEGPCTFLALSIEPKSSQQTTMKRSVEDDTEDEDTTESETSDEEGKD